LLQSFAAKQAQKSPYSAVTIEAFLYGGERGIFSIKMAKDVQYQSLTYLLLPMLIIF